MDKEYLQNYEKEQLDQYKKLVLEKIQDEASYRTMRQLNFFHDKMLSSKNVALSFLSNSIITDPVKRDEGKAELSKILMSKSIPS